MSTIREELAAIAGRAEAATAAPWWVTEEVDGVRAGRYTVVRAEVDRSPNSRALRIVTVDQTRPHHDADAEANVAFIAAARTDVPRLVGALTTILDLHVPFTAEGWTFCVRCPGPQDGANRTLRSHAMWPCATVQAIRSALTDPTTTEPTNV